jgi:hypothetical protein
VVVAGGVCAKAASAASATTTAKLKRTKRGVMRSKGGETKAEEKPEVEAKSKDGWL